MSLKVSKGTDATLPGTVNGISGTIEGWVLTLEGQGEDADFQKTSADAEQIEILDPVARTFAIYLTPEDTAEARDIWVELRAVANSKSYLLAHLLIEVLP